MTASAIWLAAWGCAAGTDEGDGGGVGASNGGGTAGDGGNSGSGGGAWGGSGGSSGSAGGCVPGSQMSCPCPGGALGVQQCLPDGSGYGECTDCGTGTGGSAGAGGAAGTSGSAGGAGSSGSAGTAGSAGTSGGPTETCSQVALQNNWQYSICEPTDGTCTGSGVQTVDCTRCCEPSCGQIAMTLGYAQAACDNGSNGACAGLGGVKTRDCVACCDTAGGGTGGTAGSGGSGGGGQCYSATLQQNVDTDTCVQSSADCLWYKCNPPNWFLQGDGSSSGNGCSSTNANAACNCGTCCNTCTRQQDYFDEVCVGDARYECNKPSNCNTYQWTKLGACGSSSCGSCCNTCAQNEFGETRCFEGTLYECKGKSGCNTYQWQADGSC